MGQVTCSTRICDISERAFWAALRAPRGAEELAEAIRLGKAGETARAYARLGDYHRRKLTAELAARHAQLQASLPGRQTAEDLLRHRITTWHTTVVDFGPEIDWNYAQTDQYGFHYLGWLMPGVQRLLETGETAYRDGLTEIVTSYYRARNTLNHPYPGLHLVYYELGAWAKTEVLLPLYLGLLEHGDLPVEAHEAFMKLFLGFARSLYDIQTGYHGGNWQIVGCCGLLTLASVFPEFAESAAWEERALHYLKAHLADDFFADGGHKERCWGYGYMSLSGITSAYQVAQRHGGLGTDAALYRRGIRQAFRWFAKTLGPNEHMPAYGDDALHVGSHVLDAGQAFFPAGTGRDLGVDRGKSYYLKPSGFAIMRNGDAPDATYLNLSFGPFAGWHSHMDTLNMNLWAFGTPLLEEVGRFGGYGEGLTILLRAPESHNQLTIDGMHYDNADHTEPGKEHRVSGSTWLGHPDYATRSGRDPHWRSTPAADCFTAWHGAYRANWREPQSVDINIRRTVVFVKDPGYVLVSDVASESNSNNEGPNFSVTQNWHAPFPFQVLAPGVARTAGEDACLLQFAPQPYLRRLETGADFSGDEVSTELQYPERHYLRARRWMPVEYRGATGVTVLLTPFRGELPAVQIETLSLDGAPLFRAGAFAVTTPRGRDIILLNPDRLPGITHEGEPVTARILLRLDNGRGEVLVP
jgi:hypothetical protein